MQAKEFKQKLIIILNSEIKFDGHINLVINNISTTKQLIILEWIKQCQKEIIKPEPCKRFKNLISFIYKSNNNRIRCILTKKKKLYFIELFIDKHKYYDRKRKYLRL